MMSLILTIHVIALVASVLATTIMMILVLMSRKAPQIALRANLFITGIGITLGGILLIQHPVGSRCVELTSYLVIFVLAHRYIAIRSAQSLKPAANMIASR